MLLLMPLRAYAGDRTTMRKGNWWGEARAAGKRTMYIAGCCCGASKGAPRRPRHARARTVAEVRRARAYMLPGAEAAGGMRAVAPPERKR